MLPITTKLAFSGFLKKGCMLWFSMRIANSKQGQILSIPIKDWIQKIEFILKYFFIKTCSSMSE